MESKKKENNLINTFKFILNIYAEGKKAFYYSI